MCRDQANKNPPCSLDNIKYVLKEGSYHWIMFSINAMKLCCEFMYLAICRYVDTDRIVKG